MAEGNVSSLIVKKVKLQTDMINRLVKTEAHFKHQQRGEPDLSIDEKVSIASDILQKSPCLFLERFSKHLTLEDTEFFSDQKGDYQIDFYLGEIYKRYADTNHDMCVVKNRRYCALQELMDNGDYFSEEEMKWRDPLLYEQMIGQYKTDSERADEMEKEIDKTDLRFSTILLKHMDMQTNKQYYDILKEKEEEQEEEEENSDEEEKDDMEDASIKQSLTGSVNKCATKDAEDKNVSDMELSLHKSYLWNEFLRIMQEKFLSGEDRNFDYSKVDSNADYDSLDIVGRDAEEKYFDADDDSELVSAPIISACDKLIRRQFKRMELRTEADNVKGGEQKENADMDVDDYMAYIPSEDLVRLSCGINL